MSALPDRLQADLNAARKSQDKQRVLVLGTVISELKNRALELRRELTDDDAVDVLRKAIKRRRESVEMYDGGGRPELAEKERAEAAVIADYLPQQLSEAEIAEIVTVAIAQVGAAGEGMRAMGRVMGVVQPQVRGRADGGAVAAEVRRQLG